MKFKKIVFSTFLALFVLFLSSTLVFAAFYWNGAEEYLEKVCSRRRVSGINSVLCYLNDKIKTLEEKILSDEDEQELIIGAMPDANSPQLGLIIFSGDKEEYHFWFTPNTNILDYIAGHTYHVIYKSSVDDTDEWCPQITVVDRPPYNLFGNAGELVYFKIIDVTTGDTPCF